MSLEVGIMGSSNSSGHPKSDLRVIIADDMLPIREYLKMVLSHEPDMHILAAVGTAADSVKISLAEQPDVVLMDLEMETQRAGVDAIGELAQKAPSVRCVVLTHFGDDDTVFAAFEAGAADYILKNASAVEIIQAVRAAAEDRSPIRPQVARMIRSEFRSMRIERKQLVSTLNTVYRLTPTELAILSLLARGHSQKEIAELRHVEQSTIRTHVSNILKKFDEPAVSNVVDRLRRLGIFDIFGGEHGV